MANPEPAPRAEVNASTELPLAASFAGRGGDRVNAVCDMTVRDFSNPFECLLTITLSGRHNSRALPAAFWQLAYRFEIVSLALPGGCTPESVPPAVNRLISVSWPGMSRAQLADRARRLDLRTSLRVESGSGPGGLMQLRLALSFADGFFELIAHARRVARRHATPETVVTSGAMRGSSTSSEFPEIVRGQSWSGIRAASWGRGKSERWTKR
jgi:hypothetical protein